MASSSNGGGWKDHRYYLRSKRGTGEEDQFLSLDDIAKRSRETKVAANRKRKQEDDQLKAEVVARNERKAAAWKKLEEDRKLLKKILEDPFVKFPEVAIRDYLLKHCDTPSRINLCKASRTVKRVWGTKQATWTLSEALAVPQLREVLMKWTDEDDEDAEPRRLRQYLPLSKLRMGCRDWRWAVDNFFNELYGQPPSYSNWRSLRAQSPNPMMFQSDTPAKYEYDSGWYSWAHGAIYNKPDYLFEGIGSETYVDPDNLFSLEQDHNNPVITKSVEIDLEPQDDHRERISKFVDRYGHQIRQAYLGCTISSTSWTMTEQLVELLASCLEKLPNVTSLSIQTGYRRYRCEKGCSRNCKELSLPPLPGLVCLNLRGGLGPDPPHVWNPCLLRSLDTYLNQLYTLSVHDSHFMELHDPGRHSTFPNLQRLKLSFRSAEALLKMRHWRSPLKEVELWGGFRSFNPSIGLYLHALERFWTTLVAIKFLCLGRARQRVVTFADLGMEEPSTFTMPNLKILALGVGCKACYDLDVLLKLSHSIRHLEIHTRKCHHEPSVSSTSQRRLQLYDDYFDKLFESNVWELLPALGRIIVSKLFRSSPDSARYFTRKEFEERQGRRLSEPVIKKQAKHSM